MSSPIEDLLEAVDDILNAHEIVESPAGNKYCVICIGDRKPMPYSWRNCEMRHLREVRNRARDEARERIAFRAGQ